MPGGAMMSLTGKAEDSPGPDPAPEPELLPSDLSSDWPTGGEGGMVNMKIKGGEGGRTIKTTQGFSLTQIPLDCAEPALRIPTSIYKCV